MILPTDQRREPPVHWSVHFPDGKDRWPDDRRCRRRGLRDSTSLSPQESESHALTVWVPHVLWSGPPKEMEN